MLLKLNSTAFILSDIEVEIISTPEIGTQITLTFWDLGEKGKSGKFSFKGRKGLFGLDL